MMKGKSVITSILVLAVLCAAPVAVQALSIEDFAITGGSFASGKINMRLDRDRWKGYRLADWTDIVSFVDGAEDKADAFTEFVEFVKKGTGYDDEAINLEVWVKWGVDEFLDDGNTRHYYARVPGMSLQDGFGVFASMLPAYEEMLKVVGKDNVDADDYINKIVLGSRSGIAHGLFIKDIAPTPTPEPATLLLLGTGLMGLAGFARKKITKK